MTQPKIFGYPMKAQATENHWSLAFGINWDLFVMPAVDPSRGWWWAVNLEDGSATVTSGYAGTAKLAAKGIENWLDYIGNRVIGWKVRKAELERQSTSEAMKLFDEGR